MNDDNTSVRAPRKNPSISINIALPVINLDSICRKESNGLRPYALREILIDANLSMVVNNKRI